MTEVVVIGCGIVGAAIAYELSPLPDLTLTVIDQRPPAHGATGAALGILMGVISQKAKGRNWRLREASLRRYATLIPELEAATGLTIPHNRQGVLSLLTEAADLPRWESLQAIRQRQGWPLEIWSPEQVQSACPHLAVDTLAAGIYSPCDRQIAPKALTHALVAGAQQRGVRFHFGDPVVGFECQGDRAVAVKTSVARHPADWVVVAAGLGSAGLSQQLQQPLALGPVLGQGLRVRLPEPLGDRTFQPVVNGNDIHLVPLGAGDYGVAATVEFPAEGDHHPLPEAEALRAVWEGAIAYCPTLAKAEILETWYGLRPRPQGQAAPVIQPLAGYANITLATGHYRNGVFLAPATAQQVKAMVTAGLQSGLQ